MNINGINNFIKLKNKNYCLNILTFDSIISPDLICDNNDENIDINSYLINNLKNTKIKYNFFLPYFDKLNETKKYNYFKEILKLQNNKKLLKHITFIDYNYDCNHHEKLLHFINVYSNKLYFNRNDINILIYDLQQIILEFNLMFDLKNKIHLQIPMETTIILQYIYINYFQNKIKIIIYDCTELIKYCEINKNKLKKQITYNHEYYDTLKHIYKEKESIYLNIHYLLNFINVYDIILNIYSNKVSDNILYLHINLSNILVYLLITSLNFEIIKINYSDKLIDNNELLTSNKVIKNTNILNIYSLLFLEKYLTNNKNCIKINENDFL